MIYAKAKTAARVNVASLTQFLALAGVVTILPFFIHMQWVTGPLVNAILVLVLFLVGVKSAMVLSFIPSMVAMSSGLLPAILAPVVPFIMLSNVIFVLSIDFVYNRMKDNNKGFWVGALVASLLKFIFLLSSVSLISNLLLKSELAIKVSQMMSWPQFATAMTGSMLAWMILKYLRRI